jgi:hypothetical protein
MVVPDSPYAMWLRGELDDYLHVPDSSKVEVITKWSGYAKAEIPYYLLVDRSPKAGRTILYSIPDEGTGAYLHEESWAFGQAIRLPEPFGIEIATDQWQTWSD